MSTKYSAKTPQQLSLQHVLFFTQPSLLLCVALVVCMYWRIPTRIDLRLAVNAPSSAFDRAALPESLNDGRFPFERVSHAAVAFPDFKKQPPFEAENIQAIRLLSEETLRVEIQDAGDRSEVRIQGVVREFQMRSGGIWRDMRRAQFERLFESRAGIWWILGGWVLITAVGWIKVYHALT